MLNFTRCEVFTQKAENAENAHKLALIAYHTRNKAKKGQLTATY